MDKNTIYNIQAIDAKALEQTIGNKTGCKTYLDFDDESDDGFLIIKHDRCAMDGNGFIVGDETYTAMLPLHHKRDFGIVGIPYNLSEYVVLPNAYYDIEVESAIENDCKCKEDEECNCYFPPDEDFAYQEIDNIIQQAITNLIEAKFSANNKEWTLGDYSYKVGE